MLSPRSAHAQSPPRDVAARATPAVRAFTDKDGLPQNTVNALAYGTDGRLWLATQEGLATYDGNAIRAIAFPAGAASQWVDALAALPDGSIAVGMHSDGVWILKGETFEHLTTENGLPDNAVRGLASIGGESGELWIGTPHGLVVRGRDGKVSKPTGVPLADEPILTMAGGAGEHAALGVATSKAIAMHIGGAWRTFVLGEAGLPAGAVHAIAFGSGGDGDVVIGFEQNVGAFRIDGAGWRKIDGLTCSDVGALTPPAAAGSTWWLGTACGLSRVDGERATPLEVSDPPLRDIRSLLTIPREDGPPALWVGTSAGGLARVDTGGWRALTPKNSPLQSAIYAFAWSHANDGAVVTWIGSETGLSMHDGRDWHDVPLPNSDPYVNAILEAHGDTARGMWVATFGGVSRRRDDGTWVAFTESSGLPSHVVLALAEVTGASGQPELFAGLRRGLAHFNGERWESITEPGAPNDKEVTSITETPGPSGRRLVWVATSDAGLFRRDRATWTQVQGGTTAGLGKEILQVQAMALPGDRARLFVSTGEHGIAWFDPREESPRWFGLSTKSSPPLPDDVISGTQQDRLGHVYAFTNHGIARLVPRDAPDAFDVDVFTTEDGLPSSECNTGASAIDPLGRVWAGTVAGAAVLEPATTQEDRVPKRLLLRSTHLFDRQVDVGSLADLAYDESTLAFEFSLLGFHRERDSRYRTQLVGFEKEPSAWTPDAKVRYTSLPAGAYALKIWGRDYAGNVSAPVVVPFAIRTAPWLTWWAWLAYASASLSLIVLGVRMRTASLKRRAYDLSERVTERTAELAKRNAELADSIRELDRKNAELDRKNVALIESQQRADRIFSAFADVLPGTLLDGKYRIEEKIGSGGFAAVFRAQQVSLGRSVAVKIFRPEPGNDSALALERFQREGMTASRVNHPNAIQVFDSGISAEGIPYIVMELLEGHSLGAELDGAKEREGIGNGRMRARRAIEIAIPICDALVAAHEAGLIHRDIKPDNVFLQKTKDGEVVKLLDFGIAKLLSGDDGEGSSSHTASAVLVGTPRYMAPERLTRGTYDDRSDVYSVGVILYEMIAGRSPWREPSGDLMVMITNIVSGATIPMAALGVPAPLAEVVMRAIAIDAEDRPTAHELHQQLVALLSLLTHTELDAVYGDHQSHVDPSGPTAQVASRRNPPMSGESPVRDVHKGKTVHVKSG